MPPLPSTQLLHSVTCLLLLLQPLVACAAPGGVEGKDPKHGSRRRPNILLIVGDDQGYAQVGYHNKTVLTPRLDELAAQGIRLESYYVQPVCSPTRSVLMTGRYTHRLGTQATVIRADVPFGIPLKEKFLPENLKEAGYHTALYGKVSLFHI